ncbi:MAG: hypothetical protein PVF91_13565 [Chromatiales bacterium]
MLTRTTYQIIFDSGLRAAREGRFQDAYQIWLPLAKEGYSEAQISVAILLHNGWGIEQDVDAANDWLAVAAQSGQRVRDKLSEMIDKVKHTDDRHAFLGAWVR